MYIDT